LFRLRARSRRSLDYIIARTQSGACFLKGIGVARPLQSIRIERLDHNTKPSDIPAILEPLLAGNDADSFPRRGCRLLRPGAAWCGSHTSEASASSL